jgi:hypothetical protein
MIRQNVTVSGEAEEFLRRYQAKHQVTFEKALEHALWLLKCADEKEAESMTDSQDPAEESPRPYGGLPRDMKVLPRYIQIPKKSSE